MFERFTAILDFIEKVSVATPEVLADLQKLLDDAKRPFVNAAPRPATVAELVAAMQAGNDKVQAAPRFLVNDLAKQISAAVTAAVLDDETIAAAILAKL